eukprot:TRINITY_DN2847_c0_g1_i3.p1 TRINITY_DN2847_c0_g1~~TRINITY_DN2847_c0_g1_i3.p1  ORF type:complete len:651 (+),score=125.42 TRINITY_DN2847_c0_g1_i3:132-2084(+)
MDKEKRQMVQTRLLAGAIAKGRELISLDKRSLALLRIALGVTVLYDMYDRARDMSAHYTDSGVMHRSVILSHFWSEYWFSFYMFSGNYYYIMILFAIHFLIGFLVLIGYRTQLMLFLNYIFTISIQTRNIIIGHSGDTLQVLLFFWAMFLPMSEHFSVDAMLNKEKEKPNTTQKRNSTTNNLVTNVAAVAFIFQILIMYVAAHNLKVGSAWRVDRTAAYLALGLDFFRRPFGDLLMMFPLVLKFMTFSVLWWQGIGPWLYFSPIFTGPLKSFVCLGFFSMHMGFGLSMRLGQFSFITCSGILGLIPGWFWDTLFKLLRTKQRVAFRLFYVPNCTACTRFAHVCETFFLLPESKIVPVISLKNEEDPTDHNENHLWLSTQNDAGVYYNWQAFHQLCKASPVLYPLSFLPVERIASLPPWRWAGPLLREAYHNHHRSNRDVYAAQKVFHSQEESFEMQVIKLTWKVLKVVSANLFALLCLVIIFGRNASSLGYYHLGTPGSLYPIMYSLHLDQYWAMFTPSPPNSWWWYNIEGELGDNTKVELWANGGVFSHIPNIPHTFDKPPSNEVYLGFKNHRWFKFFENGYNGHSAYETMRLEFGRWICREYNAANHGDKRLWKFAVHLMSEEDNPQHDGSRTFTGKQTLWNHLCYEQ